MRRSTVYGAALVCGAVGMVVTMLFHPTAHDLLAPGAEAAAGGRLLAAATHALALFSAPVIYFGLLGLSRQLGTERPLVTAALVAYGFALAAAVPATVASGLVAPALTRQMLAADPSDAATRDALHRIFSYNGLVNQSFSKVYVVASSLAVVGWSLALFRGGRFARLVAVFGCVVGALSLTAFFAGRLRLDVHGFGLFVFAQSAWVVLAGVLLHRRADSPRGA